MESYYRSSKCQEQKSQPLPRQPSHHEIHDRLQIMWWQECTRYETCDYLALNDASEGKKDYHNHNSDNHNNPHVVNEQWRARMGEWAYQLIDHLDVSRSIVGICMNYLDRYLSNKFLQHQQQQLDFYLQSHSPMMMHKREFQVVTMCCLYVALKIHAPHGMVNLDYMVQLSRDMVTAKQLEDMEFELLASLKWWVHPPTAADFLQHYVALFPLAPRQLNELRDSASYLVELSVLDYFFTGGVKPSTVAAAALWNVCEDMGFINCRPPVLPGEEYTVHLCRQRLASLFRNASAEEEDPIEEDVDVTEIDEDDDDEDEAIRVTSPVSVFNVRSYSGFPNK